MDVAAAVAVAADAPSPTSCLRLHCRGEFGLGGEDVLLADARRLRGPCSLSVVEMSRTVCKACITTSRGSRALFFGKLLTACLLTTLVFGPLSAVVLVLDPLGCFVLVCMSFMPFCHCAVNREYRAVWVCPDGSSAHKATANSSRRRLRCCRRTPDGASPCRTMGSTRSRPRVAAAASVFDRVSFVVVANQWAAPGGDELWPPRAVILENLASAPGRCGATGQW